MLRKEVKCKRKFFEHTNKRIAQKQEKERKLKNALSNIFGFDFGGLRTDSLRLGLDTVDRDSEF